MTSTAFSTYQTDTELDRFGDLDQPRLQGLLAVAKQLRQDLLRVSDAIDKALDVTAYRADRTNIASRELIAALPFQGSTTGPLDLSPALGVFEHVRDMLDLDDQRTAALAGISRNTPRDWRNGNRPRAATTRRLYELVGVLDLVATVEPDIAAWSRSVAPDGRSWIEVAADADGASAILRYRRSALLTPRPPARLEVADYDDTELSVPVPADPNTVRRRPGPRRRPR